MLYETDPNGNPVDSFVLDIQDLQLQCGLHVIDDGEYLIGGTLSGEHHFRESGFIMRYHMNEDSIIWSHDFHSTDFKYETLISFIESKGDTVLIGGYGSNATGHLYSFLKAMSPGGEEYWSQEYEGDDYFLGTHLLPDGIVVVGGRGRFGIAEGQVLIKKVSYSGEELWTRIHDFPGRARVYGITETADGGMLLCGKASGAGPLLLKIDQTGDILWSRIVESAEGEVIDGTGYDISASVNRITCVGFINDTSEEHSTALTMQTTGDGLLVDNPTVGLPTTQPLRAFPNPASTRVFVDLPTGISWKDVVVGVYTSDSRLLLQQDGLTIQNGISTEALHAGLYYLYIRLRESGQLVGTASFVKQ